MEPANLPTTVLLQKYLEGTISESEGIELFAFLKENAIENNVAFERLLQDVYKQSFAEQPALSADAGKRILERLLVSAGETVKINVASDQTMAPVHRVHFLRRGWFRYVAAAVLVIALSGVIIKLVVNNNKENKQFTSVNRSPGEIPPGSSRAVLMLANGQEILLDSSQGSIIENEKFTVNNENGKLDYEGKADIAESHTLSTPRGGQYQLQLPDGTRVWLNAASRISYPTAFGGSNRKVTIAGEVYFEVAKNKSKPFIVDVDDKASIEVLGTHFNVNAYTDELGIRTTLLEGSIKMLAQQQQAILQPGQQAQFSGQEIKITDKADLEMTMAWRKGWFQFNHTRLDEVLRQLSRWYDVDVAYEQKVPDIIFSGAIKRDLNLSQALIVLEKMGVHFRIEGKKLIVIP